jgi:hypothetical protein
MSYPSILVLQPHVILLKCQIMAIFFYKNHFLILLSKAISVTLFQYIEPAANLLGFSCSFSSNNICPFLMYLSGLYLTFSTVNSDGFKPNLENHLAPLLATKYEDTTVSSDEKKGSSSSKIAHHPLLLQVILSLISLPISSFSSEKVQFRIDRVGLKLHFLQLQKNALITLLFAF